MCLRLETLSIDGNPINSPPHSVTQAGTFRIVTYLRDSAPPLPPPPPRRWKVAQTDQSPGGQRYKIITYNVLAESYATEEQHPYTPKESLKWENRKIKILEDILEHEPDIICLQEVEMKQFQYFFLPNLQKKGYDGVHKLKTRARVMSDPGSVDGCSIFYQTSKFKLEEQIDIEYQTLAINNNIPPGPGLDRTLRRDNIAIFLVLQILPEKGASQRAKSTTQPRRLLVCNTHIHWDPAEADVKLVQVQFMLDEIDKLCNRKNEPNMPMVIAGDFNSEPSNAVFTLLQTGKVDPTHKDWNGTNYGKLSKEGCSHRFKLQNCFGGICEPEFSNYNGDFMGILDYIWYTSESIRVLGALEPPTKAEILEQKSPLPNCNYPSDHIFLLSEFEIINPSKRRGN